MREIIVTNEDLRELMQQRHEAFNESKELQKQIEELQNEQVKMAYKIDKYKKKMEPFAGEEEKKMELTEFEYIENIELVADKVKFTIKDMIEEAIARYREAKAKEGGITMDTNAK